MGYCISKNIKVVNPQRNDIKIIQYEETLTTSLENIKKVYKFERNIIGHGHFASVRIAYHKNYPTLKVAVKTISKLKIKDDMHLVMRELQIIKQLDHPNIVNFYEVYQEENFFHIVMEYCSGGELLEKVSKEGRFTESRAARILEGAFSAVKYMHQKDLVHRDLKLENFLFVSTNIESDIKLIDFGLSTKYSAKSGEYMRTVAGTSLYVAPEILKGGYNEICDEWSLGVIMYILLSGSPPFDASNNQEIFQKVLESKYKLEGDHWDSISKEAKDLIRRLLEPDPLKRLCVSKALEHEWFKINLAQKNMSSQANLLETENNKKIMQMIRSFDPNLRLRKEVLRVIVNFLLSDGYIKYQKDIFKKINKNKSGMIAIEELQEAMRKIGFDYNNNQIIDIIKKISYPNNQIINKNPIITYKDFLCATLDDQIYLTKDKLSIVFKYFDLDKNNYVTIENLKEIFARTGRKLPDEQYEILLKEVDKTNNNKITFEDFIEIMIQPKTLHSKTNSAPVLNIKNKNNSNNNGSPIIHTNYNNSVKESIVCQQNSGQM